MESNKNIVRVAKSKVNPYVMLNKYFLNDDRLSWKAKGLLAYLLSKPDDWTVYLGDLERKSTDGRDSVRKGLSDLEKIGYLKRTRHKGADGRFYWESTVYEKPVKPSTEKPSTEKPSMENPSTENPHIIINNELPINELLNNEGLNNVLFSEIENISLNNADEVKKIIIYYFKKYKEVFNKNHPKIKKGDLSKIAICFGNVSLPDNDVPIGITHELFMIDSYFNTKFDNCNYSILHYCSGNIRRNKFLEVYRELNGMPYDQMFDTIMNKDVS